MHIRLGRISVTIAVHAQTVHDIDIQDIAIKRVHYRFSGFRHRLQKSILTASPAGGTGSTGVNPAFTLCGGNANGNILDRSTKSRHRVALKMGQHHKVIIIGKVHPHIVLCQVASANHR
jgi:hypothetical protein